MLHVHIISNSEVKPHRVRMKTGAEDGREAGVRRGTPLFSSVRIRRPVPSSAAARVSTDKTRPHTGRALDTLTAIVSDRIHLFIWNAASSKTYRVFKVLTYRKRAKKGSGTFWCQSGFNWRGWMKTFSKALAGFYLGNKLIQTNSAGSFFF